MRAAAEAPGTLPTRAIASSFFKVSIIAAYHNEVTLICSLIRVRDPFLPERHPDLVRLFQAITLTSSRRVSVFCPLFHPSELKELSTQYLDDTV